MRYCITHEMVIADWDMGNEEGNCILTFCPPPEIPDGWEWTMSLPEPSEEEMLLMDMGAEVLEEDFIGV